MSAEDRGEGRQQVRAERDSNELRGRWVQQAEIEPRRVTWRRNVNRASPDGFSGKLLFELCLSLGFDECETFIDFFFSLSSWLFAFSLLFYEDFFFPF